MQGVVVRCLLSQLIVGFCQSGFCVAKLRILSSAVRFEGGILSFKLGSCVRSCIFSVPGEGGAAAILEFAAQTRFWDSEEVEFVRGSFSLRNHCCASDYAIENSQSLVDGLVFNNTV